MNGIVLYFISGAAFITGNILIAVAVFATVFEKYFENCKFKLLHTFNRLAMVVGALFIFVSSPAIPLFYIQIICLGVVSLIFAMKLETKVTRLFFLALRGIVVGFCVFLIVKEIPYRRPLIVPPVTRFDKMYVIGDSLSAGIGFKGEQTWIERLEEQKNLPIIPFVAGGATLDYALDNVDKIPDGKSLILLEIGGNDILRKTEPGKFAKKLDQLLRKLDSPKRMIVMVELPLPPLHNSYAHSQRTLAKKYNVHLIPRAMFAAILDKDGTTDDKLHLSNEGQQRLADLIWQTVGNVFPEQSK